jgi:hypothetical protein
VNLAGVYTEHWLVKLLPVKGERAELDSGTSLWGRELNVEELDLELADVLPHRETLGVPAINLNIEPIVTINTGVATATQVLSFGSTNGAWVFQYVHVVG